MFAHVLRLGWKSEISLTLPSGCCCLVAQSRPTLLWTHGPEPRPLHPQALLSIAFPRQEYWSGLPFPFPWDLPHPGVKPTFPMLADRFSTTEPPRKPFLRVPLYLTHCAISYHLLGFFLPGYPFITFSMFQFILKFHSNHAISLFLKNFSRMKMLAVVAPRVGSKMVRQVW